ncbi:hypothetical protein ITP53_24715 [Nonomuraea sp. K274]|uniref:Uncharacterized protein n=1 Tax=Nonomuraea cypriaca TaxID=1187855 RepID=A0A931A9J7_9ACTN|nr:hypothetical protein [Nonomuraea cypriaca]MBF8188877.1 hypothetical protein [Nonomuraea cypriaca]
MPTVGLLSTAVALLVLFAVLERRIRVPPVNFEAFRRLSPTRSARAADAA